MARTKLHEFMDEHGITDTQLAKASAVSVRYINYVKLGQKEPSRPYMAAIFSACRGLARRKTLRVTDIFTFDADAERMAS